MPAESIELILQAKDIASEVVKKLKENIDELPSSVDKASGGFGGLGNVIGNLKGVIAAFVSGLAAVGIVKVVEDMVSQTEDLGKQVRSLQRETGMSAEAASGLIAVAEHVGVSFDTLQTGVVALERRLGALKGIEDVTVDASGKMIDVFEKFGITVKNADGTVRPFADIFDQIRQRIQETSSETERMAIATQFFRGSAAALMPVLSMTKEEYAALYAEAQKYGLILTGENVAAIKEYTFAHKEMDEAIKGAKLAIGLELMPTLTEFAKWVASHIADIREWTSNIRTGLNVALLALSGTFEIAAGVAMVLASGIMKVVAAGAVMVGQLDFAKKAWAESNILQAAGADLMGKGASRYADIGDAAEKAGTKVVASSEKQMSAAEKLRLANEAYVKSWEDALRQSELAMKTQEAQVNLNIAQQAKLYAEGKIGIDDFMSYTKAQWAGYNKGREEQLNSEILLIKEKIKDRLISEEEGNKQIEAKTEELNQFKIKVSQEDLKQQADYHKESLAMLDRQGVLKMEVIRTQNALEAAQDEVLLKQGEMRQSESLQRQLDRVRNEMEEEISLLTQKMDKEAALAGTGSFAYQKMYDDRAKLQAELEGKIIVSEQHIKDAREKEETDAATFIAEATKNRIALIEIEKNKKLKENEEYYKQSLIDEEQYEAAKKAIEAEAAEKAAEVAKKLTTNVTYYFKDAADAAFGMVQFYRQMAGQWAGMFDMAAQLRTFAEKVRDTYKDVVKTITSSLDVVQDKYAQIKSSGLKSLSDAEGLMKNLAHMYATSVEGFYNWMTGAGKDIAASVGMTVKDWVGRVADYIGYVKGLMADLEQTIMDYQDQLDRLRGNDMAILERWYEKEKEKLKQKFLEELGDTVEYYKALATLDELYAEKKKELLDKEVQDYKDSIEEKKKADGSSSGGDSGSGGSSSSGGGGFAGSPSGSGSGGSGFLSPLPSDVVQGIKDSVAASFGPILENLGKNLSSLPSGDIAGKTIKNDIELNLTMPALDGQGTERWFGDIFMPLFKKELSLRGINLDKLAT